jgi:hypothetical protein
MAPARKTYWLLSEPLAGALLLAVPGMVVVLLLTLQDLLPRLQALPSYYKLPYELSFQAVVAL